MGVQGNDAVRMQVYLWTGKGRFMVMGRKDVERPEALQGFTGLGFQDFRISGLQGNDAPRMHLPVPVDGQGPLKVMDRGGGRAPRVNGFGFQGFRAMIHVACSAKFLVI